jgi:hypothetical protein
MRYTLVLTEKAGGGIHVSMHDDVPWEWFGKAKDDVTWDALFDEIEQLREATRKAR